MVSWNQTKIILKRDWFKGPRKDIIAEKALKFFRQIQQYYSCPWNEDGYKY